MDNYIILVNKEAGPTSRKVINDLEKILKIKKIGHTGTLDPMATGILVCLTNKYTKLVPLLSSLEKEYIAEIKLGIKTDTLDITGNIIETKDVPHLNEEKIKEILENLQGEYLEDIPLYSAKKVAGKRLYEYARKGEEVKLPQNKVFIEEIKLLDYHGDLIKFRAKVSKGTYIRSLIQTICDNLATIGTMASLERTKQGIFPITISSTLEDIAKGNFHKLKIEDVLNVQVINIKEEDTIYKKVINGNKLIDNYQGYVLYKKNNQELALYNFNHKEGRLVIKII